MSKKTEKLSFEELIKSLKCCAEPTPMCDQGCPASKYDAGECFDLVKKQAAVMLMDFDAENKQLNSDVLTLTADNKHLQELCQSEKAKVEKINQKLINAYKEMQRIALKTAPTDKQEGTNI